MTGTRRLAELPDTPTMVEAGFPGYEAYSWVGIYAAAGTPENKAAPWERADAAATKGIFGAPTFVTSDGEIFWGDDRLEQALAWAAK